MALYVAIWIGFAALMFAPVRLKPSSKAILLAAAAVFLVIFVGLRDGIGADWSTYLDIYHYTETQPLKLALLRTDPAYVLLNVIAIKLGLGIYFVNLICAAVFIYGLTRFCLRQPLPGFSLIIAIPYIVFVMGMGYVRQSVAMGLIFLALIALEDRKVARFIIYVVAAATFHKAAIVMMPLFLLTLSGKNRLKWLLLLVMMAPIGAILLLDALMDRFSAYASSDYASQGGAIRVVMCAIPAMLFLINRRKWRLYWPESARLWTAISCVSIASLGMLAVSSVIADRFALYLSPLQIAFFSRYPILVRSFWKPLIFLAITAYYAAVLITWFSVSKYVDCCWAPYRSVLF